MVARFFTLLMTTNFAYEGFRLSYDESDGAAMMFDALGCD